MGLVPDLDDEVDAGLLKQAHDVRRIPPQGLGVGGRKRLPATRTLDLRRDPAGAVLDPRFRTGFEYSDCQVDDARLDDLAPAERQQSLWLVQQPGKRLALPHSRVLLHQPYGQVGYGQVTDLEIAANEILRMRELLEEILANHTGQPLERIHNDTDRDFVLEANEALSYGIIDDVITSRHLADRTGPIR